MNKIRVRQIFTAILVLVSLFVSACNRQPQTNNNSQPSTPREKVAGVRGGSVSYRVAMPPQTFNYLTVKDEASLYVAFYLTTGRIVEFNHDEQTYTGGLAESWKLAEDNKTVDLTLREGLKFSDGKPLTTEDVMFTLKALYDAKTESPIFKDSMMINGKQIEIKKNDDRRFQLIFPETVATPENYLSNLGILPKHILEADFNIGKLKDSWGIGSDPQKVVTSGAFAVESVTVGERVTLKRNEHYWKKDQAGNQLPYLDKFVIEIIPDANNAYNKLTQGALDVLDRLRPTDYATSRGAQQSNAAAYDLGAGLSIDVLLFNLNETVKDGKPLVDPSKLAWLKDIRFRRALSHAIDRQSMSVSTLQGLATPLNGIVSPGNRKWAATDLPAIQYDLKQSQSLLAEAGFTVKQGTDKPELLDAKGNPVELTLLVQSTNEPRKNMAAVIQEDLGKLGVKLNVVPLESGEYTRRTKQSYEFELALDGFSATEPDPSSYTNLLKSDSAAHLWNPKQPKPATDWEKRIDELVASQANSRDPQQRLAHFKEIQKIMAEQLPVIPIVSRHIASAANRRVGNYRPSILMPFSLWNAEELFVK